jgi:hypothetical protein
MPGTNEKKANCRDLRRVPFGLCFGLSLIPFNLNFHLQLRRRRRAPVAICDRSPLAFLDAGSKVNHVSAMPTRVAISPELELKRSLAASILQKMEEENLSISALAERIGTGRTAVRRILDARNTSITFRSMSRAAHAVGLKIKLIAEPMSPDELGHLAQRLAKSKTKTESATLTAQITEGFYAGS